MNKQKNILKILIILILLLVIAVGVVFAYTTTDLFKTPDQLFKKYLLSSIWEVYNFNIDPYRDALEKIAEEPSEITANQKVIMEDNYSEEKMTMTMVEKFMVDPVNKNSAIEIDIKNNDKNFLNLSLLGTGETFGIHIPELHEKYLSLENRDLKKVYKTLGATEEDLEMVPDKIEYSEFTEEEKEKLLALGNKYLEKITTQIDETFYTKESYTIDDFDGQAFKGNKYTLTISDVLFGNIFINIYKELLEDPEFLSLIEGRVDSERLDALKEEVAELEPLEDDEGEGNILISFYSYKGKAIRLEIILPEGDTTKITLLNGKTSSHLVSTTVTPKTEYVDVGYETVIDMKNTFENNKGEFWIAISETYNKDDLAAFKKEKTSGENSFFSSFYDDEYFESRYSDTVVTYKIDSTASGNNITSNLAVDGLDEEEMTLNESKITVKFGPEVKVPVLNEENSLVVNDYTKEDFTKLGTEIAKNVTKSVEENPDSLIGSFYSLFSLFGGGISIDSQESELDNIENTNEETEWFLDETEEVVNDEENMSLSDELASENIVSDSDDAISNATSEMQKQEIGAFNAQFTGYLGDEISGGQVRALLTRLSSNLMDYTENPERVPSVIFGNDIIVYLDGNSSAYNNSIAHSRTQAEVNKTYKIEASYDEATGIITTITIEEDGKVTDTTENVN